MTEESLAPEPKDHPSVVRYRKFKDGGKSIADIATEEGITVEGAKKSIAEGKTRYEMALQSEVLQRKVKGQLENEIIRKRVRRKLANKFLAALDQLLEGKRVMVSIDKATGKILTQEVVDPDMLVAGVTMFHKTVSLEEKPAAAPTVQLNVQNNQNIDAGGGSGWSFEQQMEQIRRKQLASIGPITVDVPDAPEEIVPEAEVVQPEPTIEAEPTISEKPAEPQKESESEWQF